MSAREAPGGGLVVVLAHPDDESLACGGTIARCAEAGIRVTLVCATRGQRGPSHDAAAGLALPAVREAELRAAALVLGATSVRMLDYPDGSLSWSDGPRIEDEIKAVLRAERAADVITFGRDGLYWHPDHVALADRVFAAARQLVERPAVSCVIMPPGAVAGLVRAVSRRRPEVERTLWGIAPHLFGHGALPPEHLVDVRSVVERKVAALHCHRSQLSPSHPLSAMTVEEAADWLGTEAFHAAPVDGLPRSALMARLGSTPAGGSAGQVRERLGGRGTGIA